MVGVSFQKLDLVQEISAETPKCHRCSEQAGEKDLEVIHMARNDENTTRLLGGALACIRSAYPALAPAEQKVADAVLADPVRVVYSSITEMSHYCGVGESTIIRFCHSIGFSGFQELKLVLSREAVIEQENFATNEVSAGDSLSTIAAKLTQANKQMIEDTLQVLDLEELEAAVDAIVHARRVEFYGVGASGFTAGDAKYKFMRIGIQCEAIVDPHLQAMSAALLTSADVALGISYSGSTRDVADSLKKAKDSGAVTICLTSHLHSPITEVAAIKLLCAAKDTPLGSGAVRSKIAQLHVLDLLYMGVVMRMYDRALAATQRTAEAVLDKLY